MVVPAFGFSAGDFIALVGVLKKTARALRNTGGASSQYQHAVLELRSLRSALLRLQSLEPIAEDSSIVEDIRKCSKACVIPLDGFLLSIEKLDERLTSRVPAFRKRYSQVQWAMKLEPKLKHLERSLDAAIQPLKMLLLLEARQSSINSDKLAAETNSLAHRLCGRLEDFVGDFGRKAFPFDTVTPTAMSLEKLSIGLPDFRNEVSTAMGGIQSSVNLLHTKMRSLELSYQPTRPSDASPSDRVCGLAADKSADICKLDPLEVRLVRISGKVSQLDVALLYLLLDTLREDGIKFAIVLICLMPAVQQMIRSWSSIIRAPTWLLENNIHLEDCLGRPMSLPFEHFRHWDLVHAKLETVLQGTPGEIVLKTNRFQIFVVGSSLDKDNWDGMIFPRAKVTMSVQFDNQSFGDQCPSCDGQSLTANAQGWKSW